MDLVRLAVRAVGITAGTSIVVARRVLGDDTVQALGSEARDGIRRLLGVTDPPEEIPADPRAQLKERGAELLASAGDRDTHPAYDVILASLAPDEARILRLIVMEGARAAIETRPRRHRPPGTAEPTHTAIATDAKLRHPRRLPTYLGNLQRLGLVVLSEDPVTDPDAYRALEQDRGRTVRRSFRITPFGREFCEVCLPVDTAGFLALKDEIGLAGRGRVQLR